MATVTTQRPTTTVSHTMTQLPHQQFSQHTQPTQHTLAGPSRRPRGRPPGSTNERMLSLSNELPVPGGARADSANGPASSTRTKNGCWSCRVRRKKCDEGSANRQGICNNCARLEIECLGWGAKRPEWMRDKDKVKAWKENVTQTLKDKGMIRGVPRTNPPAQPPFTCNPRASRMTPPESVADNSPVSPVSNVIPGAGPLRSYQPRSASNRSIESRTAPGAAVMPPTPGSDSVVPTQPMSQELSDESDSEDFGLSLDGDPGDALLNNFSPELMDMPQELIGQDLDTLGIGSMGVGFGPVDSFGQTSGSFGEVEEIHSPGVTRIETSGLGFTPSYGGDFGQTTMSPTVFFGPTVPYVHSGEWANYHGYQTNEYNNHWQNPNGYGFEVTTPYQEQPQFSPPMLRTPTLGLDQDRLRNMLILYYFKHVRQMQYVFAGDVTTNVMMHHAQMDPQGVVSLALCSLAALHDSRMRIANGIMPNDQRARGPADKYYQRALQQLQGNQQRNGRLTDADATAALHFVSFWLFAGGSGDWPTALQIAGDWYEQSNLSAHENPMKALMEMNDNAKHASKTTMWMDIFSSISLCKSPRFLKLYRRLLNPHTSFFPGPTGHGLQLENVMGCADGIMLCLAEIADLACWKAQQTKNNCLSMPELVRRGLIIEKDLRREGQSLSKIRADASVWGSLPPNANNASPEVYSMPGMDLPTSGVRLGQSLSPPSSPPLPNAVLDGDELRRLVSDIFREAAILYLHTELSELRPQVTEIKRAVADTVNALRKLPCSEYDRSLVFPLALAGCATDEPEMRNYVRGRIKQLSSAVGNCATAGQLIEHVWERRDSQAGLVIGWREAMEEINMTILLV